MTADFECVLEKVGGWGRYQKIVVSLICLMFVPMGFFVFSPVFTYLTPPHRCYIPDVDGVASNATNVVINNTGLETYIPSLPTDSGEMELARCVRYAIKVIPLNISLNTSYNITNKQNLETSTDRGIDTDIDRETESCLDGYVYMDPEGRSSAVIEFNLVCDNAWKKPVLTAGLIFGLFLGGFILGPVTDRFGRRLVCLINMVLNVVLVVILGFASTYELLVLMVIVIGASHIVWYGCTFVLAQELVDRKHRALVACMVNVIYALGYMLLPGVAFLIKDWRWMIRALGLGSAIFIPYIFFLPESPRWLASQGRYAEACEILKKIGRINKASKEVLEDLETNNLNLGGDDLLDESTKPSLERRKSSVHILANNSVMRSRSLLLCWVWNVSFLCYYVLGLNTSNLGGSNYFNCFVAAALEIPSHFLVVFTIQKAGRRSSLTAFIGLAGACLTLSPALGNFDAASITFAMLGKFFASSTMGILYLYTSELYPTLLRSTGLGIASMSSRFGSICAPFLVFFGENNGKYVPFYVMAALSLLTAGLCLFLPETRQSPLPDTIQDAVNLEEYRISFSCKPSKSKKYENTDVIGISDRDYDQDECKDLV